MTRFRWLLTSPDGHKEICSLPPLAIAEVRERYRDYAVQSLPDDPYSALKARKLYASSYQVKT